MPGVRLHYARNAGLQQQAKIQRTKNASSEPPNNAERMPSTIPQTTVAAKTAGKAAKVNLNMNPIKLQKGMSMAVRVKLFPYGK